MSEKRNGPDTSSLPWGPVTDPVAALVGDLRAVRRGGTIRILAGEASPFIYSDPAVIEAATFAKRERRATLHVSVGPFMTIDGHDFNGLLRLRRDRVLESLTARQTRGSMGHFRIVETNDGYCYHEELPHPPGAAKAKRRRLLIERLPDGHVAELAEARCSQFDRLTMPGGDAVDGPLLLMPFGLDTLLRLTKERGRDFDAMTGSELRTTLLQAGPSWTTVKNSDELHPNQWLLMKVAAFDDRQRPWCGKIVGHSRSRADISPALEQELSEPLTGPHAGIFIYYSSLKRVLS